MMKVDEICLHMSAILLKADQKHIALKAVGIAGRHWMTKEINNKMNEKQKVRRNEGIHTDSYKIFS